MTDRELRRLKRPQLIEILYYLQKELDRVKQENEELKQRLEVDREISGEAAQQLEQIVRRAVSSCMGKELPENKDSGKDSDKAGSGYNGENNDADK